MNKFIKILLIIICLVFVAPSIKVEAKTLNDLYKELEKLKQEQIEASKQKKLTQYEITALNNKITNTANEIENNRNEVIKSEQEIKNSEQKIEEKKEESKELLKFLQLSTGENVYLDYILASEDYTDFVYRYSIVTQLTTYNNNLVTELENLIKDLENKKIELAKQEIALNNKREELSRNKVVLNNQLSEITEGYVDIKDEIEGLNKEINYYKNTLGCSLNQDLEACSKIPYASGFKYPLTKAYVSSYWGWRTYNLNGKNVTDFHYGLDFGGNSEGTPVYSVAAGKVARVVYKAKCGGNSIYIYHNVNGKKYTTKYVHLLNINVKLGDIVTDKTVIGTVGGKSTATRYGGYDQCTTGAHLHFGIADGHVIYYIDSYTFNPTNIFTKLTGRGSSYSSR